MEPAGHVQTCSLEDPSPSADIRWLVKHVVSKRAVRIVLECFLVNCKLLPEVRCSLPVVVDREITHIICRIVGFVRIIRIHEFIV